jgi:hypothetical protein
VEEGAA